MTTAEQLFARICDAPDDDAARLAYADTVEPARPEHAEYIRLAVARAADERARRLPRGQPTDRERELARRHGDLWAHYLEKYVRASPSQPTDPGWALDRGFVGFVRMEPENFVALGPRLFQMAPVQHAELTGGERPVRPLFASPLLARLDSLSLAGAGLDDDDAAALAACGALQRCSWLDLSRNRIGRRGVEALAASPIMANKLIVKLRDNPCDPGELLYLDGDGTIADAVMPPVALDIEAKLGTIHWFHAPWLRQGDEPDRYHARWLR